MTMIQLTQPLPMKTPKGSGFCHFLIDYGIENDLYWVVFQDNGEIWTWSNRDVRADVNITIGHTQTSKSTIIPKPS